MVRQYDPAGYLPGRLLPSSEIAEAYYSVRCFWIETGLRLHSTAKVPTNSTPLEHLQWWQRGIDSFLFPAEASTDETEEFSSHSTFRLLKAVQSRLLTPWKRHHFDDIITSRVLDVNVTQYEALQDLVTHSTMSCGSLMQLVLESMDSGFSPETHPALYEAVRLVSVAHGLTNALRTSIPVVSTTGKLIIPAELCVKYGVKSPRYLLSALGMGDVNCIVALQKAVREIADLAQQSLHEARELRTALLLEPQGKRAVCVLLPGLASETFLRRLQRYDYLLTDRNLRNVSMLEHGFCAAGLVHGYYRNRF
jgi:Squalene/phytoene synthase